MQTNERAYFASSQGTTKRTIVDPPYIDLVSDFFECKGDFDPPNFHDD